MAPTMRAPPFVAATLACLPLLAAAQSPAPASPAMPSNHPPVGGAPKAAPSPWSDFADYTFSVKVPKGETGTWKFRTFANPGDVILEFDTPVAKGRTKGTIILVDGRGIAVKGFTPEPGFEADPLDVAVLQLKLLTQLLDAALPGGPASLKGSRAVSARDDKATLVASTPTANAGFTAPWSLKGKVERADAASVSFQLEVEAPGGTKPGEKGRWSFSGKASGSQKGRAMDDSTSLAGWTAYAFGPQQAAKAQSHTTLRFRATKLAGPFATVKDLRAYLARPAPAAEAKKP
jgi:hypothetical protein